MKKIFYFSLLIFFIAACNSNQKQKNINTEHSGEVNVKSAKQVFKDSITSVEGDKIIGNLNFFISEKEFKKQRELFSSSFAIKDEHGFNEYKIGNYVFFTLYSRFHQDSLYYVQILGYPILYENYDSEVEVHFNAIHEVLSLKYGHPDTKTHIPKSYQTRKNYTYLLARWQIGQKWIDIELCDEGSSYRVDTHIYREDFVRKVELKEKEKEYESTLQAVDKI